MELTEISYQKECKNNIYENLKSKSQKIKSIPTDMACHISNMKDII